MIQLHIRRTERILREEGRQAAIDNIESIHKRYRDDVKKEFEHLYK